MTSMHWTRAYHMLPRETQVSSEFITRELVKFLQLHAQFCLCNAAAALKEDGSMACVSSSTLLV